jgi:hypothetical protein
MPADTFTITPQDCDALYFQQREDAEPIMVNGIPYVIRHQHVYRHPDGSWHLYPYGDRYGNLYASRADVPFGGEPTDSAKAKLSALLITTAEAFAAANPDILKDAGTKRRERDAAELRGRVDSLVALTARLEELADLVESGARVQWRDIGFRSGFSESRKVIAVSGGFVLVPKSDATSTGWEDRAFLSEAWSQDDASGDAFVRRIAE